MRDSGISLGYAPGWFGGAMAGVGGVSTRAVTAHGVASRPTTARAGVGRVAERVNQSIELLPEHLREVIYTNYFDSSELKVNLKAKKLGVSASTFHRYMHKAHQQISSDLPDSYALWSLR